MQFGLPLTAVASLLTLLGMVVGFARAALPAYSMSKQEMKVAAGYYTENGKYLGGNPLLDSENEFYKCLSVLSSSSTADSNNAAICLEWTDETETGLCQCQSFVDDRYCESWTCFQAETDNSASNCSGSRRLDEGNDCFIEVESEHKLCRCGVEDDGSMEFCLEWSCEKYSNDGSTEEEYYSCVRVSSSGLYCEAWTGELESSEEIEVSSCECLDNWNGDGMCSYWTCKERGMDKCSTCNLTIAIAAFGLIGTIGVLVCASSMFTGSVAAVLGGTLWACLWSSGVVIWGGQDGAMYVGIAWGGVLITASLFKCATMAFMPKHGNTLSGDTLPQ